MDAIGATVEEHTQPTGQGREALSLAASVYGEKNGGTAVSPAAYHHKKASLSCQAPTVSVS